jgi:hypothetical protein
MKGNDGRRQPPPPPPAVQAARELRASIDALHSTVETTRRMLDARLEEPRPVDARLPVKPFRGASGVLRAMRLVPGLAAQFAASVPETHVEQLERDVLGVRCHELVLLVAVGALEPCPGAGCGRWFLRTERGVRVARWEPEELEDRYAGPGWTPLPEAA